MDDRAADAGPPWGPPWSRGHARRRLTLPVAAVLLAEGVIAVATVQRSPVVAGGYACCAAVGGLALVLLRRRPGPAVVVVGASAVVALLLVPLPPVALLPFLVAIVAATVRGARSWAVGAASGALVLPVAQFLLTRDPLTAVRSLGEVILLLAAVAAGEFARGRFLRMREAAVAAADRRRFAAEQERLRIARELHDVLAHSLSSITVQAGVGLHLAASRPEAATEALETIRGTSKEALNEVRAVLGLLRGDEQAPVRPEPDLDQLAALVADVRRSGARVAFDDDLQPRPDRPVQLALYRIVQEALTNARRHAPGAAVEIALGREGDDAVARVRDTGAAGAPIQPGNGILGMTERAALLGGTLRVDREDGWTLVEARIPAGGTR
ncbi:MAG TPA: sensor histidine kinase [Amnibacterium sp.]|nr:sensor histidine kinase [Amnibacterium sp.]